MKILIDTHIAMWAIEDSPRLTKQVVELLSDKNNEIYYSVVSIWEIIIKRINYPDEILYDGKFLAEGCDDNGYIPLAVTLPHVYAVQSLKRPEEAPPHKDPFDRLLLAQAKAEGMKFMTHDKLIPYYNEDCILSV